jgi:cellulose synthase/poly-beta-1,6-N-acetylglucosamine synthase-like glycosyltransferase
LALGARAAAAEPAGSTSVCAGIPGLLPGVTLPMDDLILVLYLLTLAGLAFFGVHRLKMLWLYWRTSRQPLPPPPPLPAVRPRVCVQCPLYNEPLVVEALLEHVVALRWPANRLEIQVLDDSTDETSGIIASWLQRHPEHARMVRHLRRPDRGGYKAGALTYGMARTDAEFFAVFDADFRPQPDFLETLMPHFAAAEVGVVQARWEFANRKASLLTRFQGVFLDAHFVVEQAARARSRLFFNFNGTAGIWRRAALDAAGGWTSDTVTEDLDVSYRAQLLGWRFVYLDRYAVPSELPESLTAFKSQQRRWTKGGIQVARKLLRTVLASDAPARVKREAFSHLTIGFVHPLLVAFSLLFVPYLYLLGGELHGLWLWFNPAVVVLAGGTSVAFYVTGQYFRRREWWEGVRWLLAAPFVMSFGLAMSVTLCAAVVEGLITRGGEFVRTPKGGRAVSGRSLVGRFRSRALFATITVCELALGSLMLAGAVYFEGFDLHVIAAVLLLKAVGFIGIAAVSSGDLFPRAMPVRA